MSTLVTINKFDGGHAEDIRTFSTDECEYALNFDMFSNPHMLIPYPDTIAEVVSAGTITDYKITDITADIYQYGSDALVALGQAGLGDANLKFFSKPSTLTTDWTKRVERTSRVVMPNTLIGYHGYAYALENDGTNSYLVEYTNTTTATEKGTVSNQITACKPFVHPEDGVLYGVNGYTIWSYNGTTFASVSTIIPINMTVTSLTNYGTYLAIACRPTSGAGKSVTFLWGRDMTLNTLQGVIDFGEGNLNVLENIGEVLVGIVTSNHLDWVIDNKARVKVWAGGEVITVKEIDIDASVGLINLILKAKAKDRLFFALSADNCIWSVCKNKEGLWAVTKDRYIANGLAITSINGLSVIDDIMFIAYSVSGSNDLLYRTKFSTNSPSSDYTSSCIYRTTTNPNMTLGDRYKEKKLEAVQISLTGGSTGTYKIKYAVDGSSFTDVIAENNSDAEIMKQGTNQTDTKPLKTGREFKFQIEGTGKARVKEIRYRYSVTNSLLN